MIIGVIFLFSDCHNNTTKINQLFKNLEIMKKNSIFAAAIAITGLVYSSNLGAFGQNRKSMTLDDKYTLSMAFHKTDTILVVVPDGNAMTETDRNDIESYVFLEKRQNKPAYVFKSESEMVK